MSDVTPTPDDQDQLGGGEFTGEHPDEPDVEEQDHPDDDGPGAA